MDAWLPQAGALAGCVILLPMKRILLFSWMALSVLCAFGGKAPVPEAALPVRHAAQMAERFPKGNSWENVPPEILREWVWPLTSLGEDEVDWFPVLEPLARKLTQGCETSLAAARKLNRELWGRVGVIYSTKRDKANQDPLHSMRIGMASCSGLSILLIDACRSVGIPARLVGCQWREKPGNHSWVEVFSGGRWFALGAAEDCAPEALWFLPDAAAALADEPRYAIYAARATLLPDGTRFYGWGVPAENVTARYVGKARPRGVRVHIAAERGGERVAVPFRVEGKTYVTPGPLQDMNDYATVLFPSNQVFTLEIGGRKVRRRAEPGAIYVEQLP